MCFNALDNFSFGYFWYCSHIAFKKWGSILFCCGKFLDHKVLIIFHNYFHCRKMDEHKEMFSSIIPPCRGSPTSILAYYFSGFLLNPHSLMLIDSWSPFSFQLGSIVWSPPFIYELSDLLAHRICCVFQQKLPGEQSSGLFLMVTYHRLGSWPISLFSVAHLIMFQMITCFFYSCWQYLFRFKKAVTFYVWEITLNNTF